MIRWEKRDRLVQGRTHAADKREILCRELSAHGEGASLSNKGRWTVDRVKGTTVLRAPKNHTIFSQGAAADAVFYIQAGKVKLTLVSPQGKEAVVAILEPGEFLGESCLAGRPVRTATAVALEDSTLMRLDKDAMICVLHEEPAFAELFMSYLLARTRRIQEDVVDQLFNPSEKRLARVLLLLAHLESDGKQEGVIPKLSAETFSKMIGTTRSRVSFFMNRFRKLGFIDYHGYNGEVHVRSSLFNVLLHD
jgi:CRP-like cAMP-binding protein